MKMNGRPVVLAEAEEVNYDDEDVDYIDDGVSDDDDDGGGEGTADPLPLPTFDVPYLRYIDEEPVDDFGGEGRSDCGATAYVVVSGTPLKILEHLLSDLRLDEQRGAPESRDSASCKQQECLLQSHAACLCRAATLPPQFTRGTDHAPPPPQDIQGKRTLGGNHFRFL
ncbi:hypothetical protein CRUP_023524 [Coryphaenoides rupestris]|nr:hypothetical protein CRUP_023524 [Coryphaenoides rupestris]